MEPHPLHERAEIWSQGSKEILRRRELLWSTFRLVCPCQSHRPSSTNSKDTCLPFVWSLIKQPRLFLKRGSSFRWCRNREVLLRKGYNEMQALNVGWRHLEAVLWAEYTGSLWKLQFQALGALQLARLATPEKQPHMWGLKCAYHLWSGNVSSTVEYGYKHVCKLISLCKWYVKTSELILWL